jgi:ribose 5-phosphate isomerase
MRLHAHTNNLSFFMMQKGAKIADAKAASSAILALEGVVDHGLFLDMATSVIIAGSDGITVKDK